MTAGRVRIGIIGTGFARTTQLPALAAVEGAQLTVIASGRRENAERAAKEFHIAGTAGGWQDVVSREDVDLVVISTPPHLHHRIALAAIAAGKHVLCEKPMALDASEAEEMAGRAEEAHLLNVIDHELRFVPSRARFRELVRDGFCGHPRHVRIDWAASGRADPARPWDWWSEAEKGGGVLGAIGSHLVDFTRWCFGEVTSVGAQLRTFVAERPDRETGKMRPVETDDYATLLLRARPESGPAIEIVITMTVVGSAQQELWEVTGSRGTLRLSEGRLTGLRRGEEPRDLSPGAAPRRIESLPDNDWARGFLALAEGVVGAIGSGRLEVKGAATFRDGWRVQQVLDAARIANADGRIIETGAGRPGRA